MSTAKLGGVPGLSLSRRSPWNPVEFSVLDEDVTELCAIEGHAEAGMTGTIHTHSSAADDEDESE